MKKLIIFVLIILSFLIWDINAEATAFTFDPFGIALGERFTGQSFMQYLHDIGVHITKISIHWEDIETEEGVYNWEKVDAYINQLGPNDKVLLNIFTSGPCTNEESFKGSTFKNEYCKERYRKFIKALVKHTNGKVMFWQRDTEPASAHHWPKDKAKEYVETQKIFYEAIKSVQPDAIVLGVNHNGNFLRNGEPTSKRFFLYVLKNMKDWFDVLDVRLYNDLYTIPERVEWFRKTMKRYGYEKPIYCTEFGGPDPRALSGKLFWTLTKKIGARKEFNSPNWDPRKAVNGFWKWIKAHYDELDPKLKVFFSLPVQEENKLHSEIECHDIVQRHLIAYASGVQVTWWWNLHSPGWDPIFGRMRLMDLRRNLKFKTYYCFQKMVEKLKGIRSIERIPLSDKNIYLYMVKKERNKLMYVAWYHKNGLDFYDSYMEPPKNIRLTIIFKKAKISDICGNEKIKFTDNGIINLNLSDKPIFIENEF